MVTQIVPRLRSAIPQAVCLVGCEDVEEVVQDATAMAARLLHSAEAAGKRVTAGNIAYYVIQHLKTGRRSTGSSTADVMASGTQLKGRTRLNSLEEVVAWDSENGGEIFTLSDVLSQDAEDPGTKAARKLDWESFCETQPARNRAILRFTAAGKPLTQLARRHRVSRSAIQANKNTLGREIRAFMGEDILAQTARLPLWKHNLAANREKLAWRKGAKD